jgi:hypothetical protein
VPGVVVVLVVIESTELLVVLGLGEKEATAPAGSVLVVNWTPPVNPPSRLMLTV